MFEGYLSFGGTEILNAARTEAYVAGGVTPQGLTVESCVGLCDSFAEAIGDDPYSNPTIDNPPWYDPANPDSADFAGLVPLGMTGLMGSTRTTEIVERLRDGAVAMRGRYASRTISVQALAVGRSECGLQAGLSWLSAALHPPCQQEADACLGSMLDLFSCCPEVCEGRTDPASAPGDRVIPPSDEWTGDGILSTATDVFTNLLANPSFELDAAGWSVPAGFALTASTVNPWVGDKSGRVQNTGPAAGVRVTYGTATAETNAVPNPGFETNLSGWTFAASPGVVASSRDTAQAHSGSASARMEHSGLTNHGFRTITAAIPGGAAGIAVTAGRAYVGSCWVRILPGAFAVATWTCYDAANAVVGTFSATLDTVTALEWALLSVAFNTPAGTARVGLDIDVSAAADVDLPLVAYVDDVTLTAGGSTLTGGVGGVVPATEYRVQVRVLGGTLIAPMTLGLRVRWFTAARAEIGTGVLGEQTAVVETFTGRQVHQPIGGVFTSPAGAAFAMLEILTLAGHTQNTETFGFDGGFFAQRIMPLDYFDGATQATPTASYAWTGTPHASTSTATLTRVQFVPQRLPTATLRSPVQPGVCDEVAAIWKVSVPSGATGPVSVIPVFTDATGVIALAGEQVILDPGETEVITLTANPSPGYPDDYRVGLIIEAPPDTTLGITLVIRHRPILTTEECIRDLRRSLNGVITVDGPTVTNLQATSDGETTLAQVEWTWVATNPWVYADPMLLVLGASGITDEIDFARKGVVIGSRLDLDAATSLCAAPLPGTGTCADSPCCTIPMPPQPPAIVNVCAPPPPAGSVYHRRQMQVAPDLVPATNGAMIWTFLNDTKPKIGVRVRVWEDPDVNMGVPVECDFAYEFYLDFLAANEVLMVDGARRVVQATCFDGTIQDASRNVRGLHGGAMEFPILGCSKRYHLAVDVPAVYPNTCAGQWTQGQPQGDLTWSLSVARREG